MRFNISTDKNLKAAAHKLVKQRFFIEYKLRHIPEDMKFQYQDYLDYELEKLKNLKIKGIKMIEVYSI